MKKRNEGFTLIELMISVLIIAILARIAVPAYRNSVIRGYVVNGTNELASERAQMEQYYQDNRTYLAVNTSIYPICRSPTAPTAGPTSAQFSFACAGTALTATTYTITATGSGQVAGFVYTIDNQNSQKTTSLPARWGTLPSGGATCWIAKKGQTC